jgi:hypothetical protein
MVVIIKEILSIKFALNFGLYKNIFELKKIFGNFSINN